MARTDELAATAYDVLRTEELAELVTGLEPIAGALQRRSHRLDA